MVAIRRWYASMNDSPVNIILISTKVLIAVITMLAYTNNTGTNALNVVLGLFFKINGTSSRVLSLLSNIGLSVSGRTIERLKETLSEDAINIAIELTSAGGIFGTIFDNIDIYNAKHQQRVHNKNHMMHLTNVALIGVDGEGIDVDAAEDLPTKLSLRGKRKAATFHDILPTAEDDAHMAKAAINMISNLIATNCPGSARWPTHKAMLEALQKDMPQDRPLPVKKTVTAPLGVFDINEGSKNGIVKLMQAIPERLRQTVTGWTSKVRFKLGDWLSIINIRRARNDRHDDITPMHRLEYIEELSQVFHFALNATHMIMRTHFGNAVTDPTSLAAHKGLLGRTWDAAKPNYAAAKSLIRHSLIARLLHIVM